MDKFLYCYYNFTILLILLNFNYVKAIFNVYEYNEEKDLCVQVERLDRSLDLKLINYDRYSKLIIGIQNDTKLVKIDLEKNLTQEIWNFDGHITQLKVKWNFNRIYLITQALNSNIAKLYEVDFYFKFISLLTQILLSPENELFMSPQPFNGYIAYYTQNTLSFLNINFANFSIDQPRWLVPNSFVHTSHALSNIKHCHVPSLQIQSLIDVFEDDVSNERVIFFIANIPIDVGIYDKNKKIRCVYRVASCQCFEMKDQEKIVLVDRYKVIAEKAKICKQNENSIILVKNPNNFNYQNCLRICPTSKYKKDLWKKTLILQPEDQDEVFIKYKLPCTNNIELDGNIGLYDLISLDGLNKILRLTLNENYFKNSKCQNSVRHYMLLFTVIPLKTTENITELFEFNKTSIETSLFDKRSNTSIELNIPIRLGSIYVIKIWIQTLFDSPYEVGSFYVDLKKSEISSTTNFQIESIPYLYEHIQYLNVSNNKVLVTLVLSNLTTEHTLNGISYIITNTVTKETLYNNLTQSKILNKHKNNHSEVKFSIDNLLEDTVYRLRLLRTSQHEIYSLSNLIEFKTLKTPTIQIQTLDSEDTLIKIKIKCHYYLKDLTTNTISTKGLLLNNICNLYRINWRHIPKEGSISNNTQKWFSQKQYIFEGQLPFIKFNKPNLNSDDKDYYYEANFSIPNLISNQKYEIFLSTYYYNQVLINTSRITFIQQSKFQVIKYNLIQIKIFIAIISVFIMVSCCLLAYLVLKRRMKKYKTYGHDLKGSRIHNETIISKMNTNGLYFWNELNIMLNKTELEKLKRIEKSSISLDKKIGSGTFGDVFEGKFQAENGIKRVAIKILKSNSISTVKIDLLKEAIALSLFSHPNLIEFYGICFDENDPKYIVLEYMDLGDLLTYLRNERYSNKFGYKQALETSLDIAKGCEFLEEKKIVHRDLAARNCLVMTLEQSDRKMLVKIGDFGLARELYSRNYYKNDGDKPLPVRWMSPESLVDSIWTTKSDVWSYGIVLWEIMTMGQQPYPSIETQVIFDHVKNGGLPIITTKCPHEIKEIMLKCWQMKADKRPKFSDLVNELERIIDENNDIKWTLYEDCLPIFDDIYTASFKTTRYVEPEDSLLDQTITTNSSSLTRPRIFIDSDYSIGVDFLNCSKTYRESSQSKHDSAISSQRKSSLINIRDNDVLVNLLTTVE